MDIIIQKPLYVEEMYAGLERLLGFLSESSAKPTLDISQVRLVLKGPFSRVLVARDTRKQFPEEIVGMASIFYVHKLAGTIAEIHDVVVDPACRGEGVGERLVLGLIADAQRYANELCADITISLTSRPSRVAANKLYCKLGFTLTARHLRKHKKDFGTNLYRMTIKPAR